MIIKLIILAVIAFIQNMVFTAVSRSRNSGDPQRHFYFAIASNLVWFITSWIVLFPMIFEAVMEGSWLEKLIVMLVYVLATSAGSVFMMKLNLGHIQHPWLSWLTEKGKGQVGKRK
jgi:hypothetical protein